MTWCVKHDRSLDECMEDGEARGCERPGEEWWPQAGEHLASWVARTASHFPPPQLEPDDD
jgi:hypothetical protein